MYKTKRHKLEVERTALEADRQSFLPTWRDCADFVTPRRPRFNLTDNNRGDRRSTKIIDPTATYALRTLRAGMMSGVTSPARPWFRLTVDSFATAERGAVKVWLNQVTELMRTIFLRSNLYQILISTYGDLGLFGTSAILIEEDEDEILRFYNIPIGSYLIANNSKMKVDTFWREMRFTIAQLVDKFAEKDAKGKPDLSIFSTRVKESYEQGRLQEWVDVSHRIGPNEDYKQDALASKHKKYSSCYFEKNCEKNGKDENLYLRESGYDYFPVLVPRWELTGEDVYGTNCPGMDSLGDVKQLQLGERRSAQAIEKKINPAMVGPSQLKNEKVSILPGDVTFYDAAQSNNPFRAAHEVNLDISHLENKQQQIRYRVKEGFYENLFLMVASMERSQVTAREIDERHEEKLLALGPVLEQLNQDLLDPLIDVTFAIALERGMIPEPPSELQGQKLKVEYISIMAQAQKMIGIGTHERFIGHIMPLVEAFPSIAKKINIEQYIDVYGELVSITPSIVRSDEEVEEMNAQEQKMIQAQQRAEQMMAASQTAKNLSQTSMEGDNAMTRLLDQAQAGSLVEGI